LECMRRWAYFLLIASQNPYAHKSIIWFTVWSSVVHGAIMGVQSFNDAAERGHLIGDVPALFLVAIILAVLMPLSRPDHGRCDGSFWHESD